MSWVSGLVSKLGRRAAAGAPEYNAASARVPTAGAVRAGLAAGVSDGERFAAQAVLRRATPFEGAASRLRAFDARMRFSDADADALLDGVVDGVRKTLRAVGARRQFEHDALSPAGLQGACGFATTASQLYLGDLGANTVAHQARIFFGNAYSHAFAVTTLPNGRTYLVDATFAQFTGPGGVPGELLRSTVEGNRLLQRLLTRGYVELDDQTAALYGRALGGQHPPRTVNDFTAANTLVNGIAPQRVQPWLARLPGHPEP
ncbi:MAG: hypothetical protein ACAI38_13920 [Myxococcota bacterium]